MFQNVFTYFIYERGKPLNLIIQSVNKCFILTIETSRVSLKISFYSRRALEVPVVAAEQFGVGRADEAAVPIDDQLQNVLVHLHHHRRHLLRGREEDDGVKSDLELGADADEGAADRLHQTFPTELQVQDVVVLIRLEKPQESLKKDETFSEMSRVHFF